MMNKQERDKRKNKPHFSWRSRRQRSIKDIATSRDLWLGIFMFVIFQLSIMFLTLSSVSETQSTPFLILSMVLAIGISVFGMFEAKKRQRVAYRQTPARPLRVLIYIGLIYLGVFAISTLFVVMKWEIPVQENQEALTQLMSRYFLPMSFITGVVAPITEELTFREYFPYAFGPSYLSFGLSSLLFTILHTPSGLIGFAMYGFLSIAFLTIRLKDNNILTSIYVHMGYNLLTVVLSLL